MLIVEKFGGTSVADAQRISRAAQKLVASAQKGNQVIGVVSAQGDLTDRLLKKIESITSSPSGRESDACVSAGEQISAALMAMAVQRLGREAVSLTGWQAGLLTDGKYGDAGILGLISDRISQESDAGKIVILAGLQGVDEQGNITTLGRGGSDTTAVTLAGLLGADVCRIYTDVDGVYDKDPRVVADARKYVSISYGDMRQLCEKGAQVLHHKCVEAGEKYGVPIWVLSSFRDNPGTLVWNGPTKLV
jgi:aspartate kinase